MIAETFVEMTSRDMREMPPDLMAAVAAGVEQNNRRRLIDLQELLEATKFSKEEIKMMYRGFKQVENFNASFP